MSHWQKEGKMPKLKNTPIHNKSQGCAPPLIFKDMIININRQKNLSLVWATEKMKFLFCATLWDKKKSRNAKLVAKSLRTPPPPICSVTTDLLSLCDNAVTNLWGAHDRRSLSSSSAPSHHRRRRSRRHSHHCGRHHFRQHHRHRHHQYCHHHYRHRHRRDHVILAVVVVITIVVVVIVDIIVSIVIIVIIVRIALKVGFFFALQMEIFRFPAVLFPVNAFPSTSWCTLEELLSRGELISWCTTKEKWIKKNKKNTGFEIFQRRAQKKPETIKLLW